MCAGDQGGSGGYVVVVVGQRLPIGGRERIQGCVCVGRYFYKALAKVPGAVVVAIAGDGVDITLPVDGETPSGLPDGAGVAIRRSHVHANLVSQVGSVVAEHPSVISTLVAMGTESDIHRTASQQQAGTLDVLHRIEADGSIGASCRAGSGHRRDNRSGAIEPFGA